MRMRVISKFGKGIWALRSATNETRPFAETFLARNESRGEKGGKGGGREKSGRKYHDTTGVTWYGSPNNILTPVLQNDDEDKNRRIMFNVHSNPQRGLAIDSMIACFEEKRMAGNLTDEDIRQCGAITSFTRAPTENGGGPGATIIQPVFPADDVETMSGFIYSPLAFDELLGNLFGSEVSGIDCVIETETEAVTYTVENGEPMLM